MRPTREGRVSPSRQGLVYKGIGIDPDVPTTDPAPPTDFASGASAFVPFASIGTVAIAQSKTGVQFGGGSPITVTLDAAPTIGNVLVLAISVDDDSGPVFTIDNGPWTQVGSTVYSGNGTNWPNRMYYQVVDSGTSAVNITGWAVQYSSSAGATWQKTDLSGMLAPGQYMLVQEASGGANGCPDPRRRDDRTG